jgi:hypothetical protein
MDGKMLELKDAEGTEYSIFVPGNGSVMTGFGAYIEKILPSKRMPEMRLGDIFTIKDKTAGYLFLKYDANGDIHCRVLGLTTRPDSNFKNTQIPVSFWEKLRLVPDKFTYITSIYRDEEELWRRS